MRESELTEFTPMWTTEKDRYLLVRVPGFGAEAYLPYDKQLGLAIGIEDDEIAKEVIARMKQAGVRVVDEVKEKHTGDSTEGEAG